MTLSNRIVVMFKGEVQQFDEPDTVYNRPANMFVAGFMGSPAMNFIPSDLVMISDRLCATFPDAAGKTAVLPLAAAAAGLAAGRRIVLGIRPEHFCRHSAETAGRPGMAQLTAPVEVVEPTGAETMAVLRIGTGEITGRFDPHDQPRRGETMVLDVDMARACLFDPDTRLLIPGGA